MPPRAPLGIQGSGAERQTVSPITSRQSRNKRLHTYALSATAAFQPCNQRQTSLLWPSWTAIYPRSIPPTNLPYYCATSAPQQQTRHTAPTLYQLRLDKLERVLAFLKGSAPPTISNIKSANAVPCRLPIDERLGPSLRTPVEERRLHGLWW